MKIRTAKRLHDALTSCNKLGVIAAADAPVTPNGNNTEMLAAERLLEIIGEALKVATRTDPTHVAETIEIRHAISLRNRIAHGYLLVEPAIVRSTSCTSSWTKRSGSPPAGTTTAEAARRRNKPSALFAA